MMNEDERGNDTTHAGVDFSKINLEELQKALMKSKDCLSKLDLRIAYLKGELRGDWVGEA